MNSECAYAFAGPDPNQVGTISSSVPLPGKRGVLSDDLPGINALLRQLKVGDSVLLPRKAREGVFARARPLKIRITTRVSGETVRVWRTE
jgi:hypothetical protein